MSSSSVFSTQLPIGKTLFLIWIVISLFHAQTGVVFSLENVSPIELGLQAGLLFGYYTFFWGVFTNGIVIVSLIFLYVTNGFDWDKLVSSFDKTNQDKNAKEKSNRKAGRWQRFFEVVSIFAAFYFYSESLFQKVALIGLALAIAFYITGAYVSEK